MGGGYICAAVSTGGERGAGNYRGERAGMDVGRQGGRGEGKKKKRKKRQREVCVRGRLCKPNSFLVQSRHRVVLKKPHTPLITLNFFFTFFPLCFVLQSTQSSPSRPRLCPPFFFAFRLFVLLLPSPHTPSPLFRLTLPRCPPCFFLLWLLLFSPFQPPSTSLVLGSKATYTVCAVSFSVFFLLWCFAFFFFFFFFFFCYTFFIVVAIFPGSPSADEWGWGRGGRRGGFLCVFFVFFFCLREGCFRRKRCVYASSAAGSVSLTRSASSSSGASTAPSSLVPPVATTAATEMSDSTQATTKTGSA
eukprot:Rhum_TRINITY_DN11741_c1_g3::Rhum_TRINITY_DN11741_c1_g3_i1::g.46986::m.46986